MFRALLALFVTSLIAGSSVLSAGPVTPTISLTSAKNPVHHTQGVNLTATVTSESGLVPTGTVRFRSKDSPVAIATVSLDPSGMAHCPTFYPNPGTWEYEALYSGDDNHQPITASIVQVVTGPTINPEIKITSSSNPSASGQPVQISAAVTRVGPMPSGTMDFWESRSNGNFILAGGVPLDGNGVATATLSLADGGHAVYVNYKGDDSHWGGTTYHYFQLVGSPNVIVDLHSSPNPSEPEQPVVFTVTVTKPDGSPAASGLVHFRDEDAAWLMSQYVDQNGVAQFTLPSITAGVHHFSALFIGAAGVGKGTTDHRAGVSVATATALMSSANPSSEGEGVVFTASVTSSDFSTPTGSVTFFVDATPMATAALDGTGTVYKTAALTPGTHTITAQYNGDVTHAPSASAPLVQTVTAPMPSKTTLDTSKNPSVDGQAVTLMVAVEGVSGNPMPTGNVALIEHGIQFATVWLDVTGHATFTRSFTLGTHTIVAVYSGNESYGSSSAVDTQVVIAGSFRQRAVRP